MSSASRILRVAVAFVLLITMTGVCSAEGSGGINAEMQRAKPYLILVSIDGFRWDYRARFDTPALDRIAAGGVEAHSLVPVFPTLTFPNHYSIATGLYPANHGIVGNRFFSKDRQRFYRLNDRNEVEDGSWYGGEPIWVTAEKNGMVSAAYFFVGTEADIDGIRPTHWNSFNENIAGARRVDQVLEWLSLPDAERPHVITLYFEDVDKYSHGYGVGSPLMVEAVSRVDGYLQRLLDGIESLPIADEVNLLVVSDHGQTGYRRSPPFIIDEVVDLEGIRTIDHGPVSFLYFDEPDPARARAICAAINRRWTRGQAVVPGDAPSSWHTSADSRFADVIVQADPRSSVASSGARLPSFTKGDHGWAPEAKEMHGIFFAMGPRLPVGRQIASINAVDVYPLMLAILGLPQTGPIDGDPDELVPLLADW